MIKMWHQFLSSWNGISLFYDDHITQPEDFQLFTDAAPFASLAPSSAIHEMYPVVVAAILWGHKWSRKIIAIHTDNSAIVDIINKGWSQCLAIMQFVQTSAQNQFIIQALHI